MRFLVSMTMRAALVSFALVSMIAATANAAPVQYTMSGSWNSVGASIDPRPLWNPTNPQLSFTLPGFAPANSMTGHVLVDQETAVAQPTLFVPREAFALSTQTRGIALGQFGPTLLQLTTRNPLAWPQLGTSPTFATAPLTYMARPPTASSPATFTWCPGAGFACTGKDDVSATVMAAMKYSPGAGARFGGVGGMLRRNTFDGSPGGHLNVRVGAIPVINPTSYSTVAAFSPIQALGAPRAAIGAGGATVIGQTGMTVGVPGVFYSVNATSMGVITKRAPSPVMTPNGGTLFGAQLNNTRWGAPVTTGMITLSQTMNAAGNSEVNTYAGFDGRTANGEGTLVMVSGMLRSGVNGEQGVSQLIQLTLSPEPSVVLGAGAALAALLGGAIVTNRRRR